MHGVTLALTPEVAITMACRSAPLSHRTNVKMAEFAGKDSRASP